MSNISTFHQNKTTAEQMKNIYSSLQLGINAPVFCFDKGQGLFDYVSCRAAMYSRPVTIDIPASDCFLIIYSIVGELLLEYRGKKHSISGCSMCFIDLSKDGCRFIKDNSFKWSFNLMLVAGRNVEHYYETYSKNTTTVIPINDNSSTLSKFEHLSDTIGNEKHENELKSFILSKQIIDILTLAVIESSDIGVTLPNPLLQALDYIDNNFTEHITLDMIADEVHLSKYTLSRMFTKYKDISLMEYVIRKRIALSCRLLASTNMNVTDISRSCGFTNDAYFIQCFKKRELVTPLQYKKRHNQLSNNYSEIN